VNNADSAPETEVNWNESGSRTARDQHAGMKRTRC